MLLSLFLLEHENGMLDEEELLLLIHCITEDTCANLPQHVGNRLNFEKIDEETCSRRYRFTKAQVMELLERLSLPARFRAPSRHCWTGLEGLLVVLRRLSYPNTLGDMCEEFGRSKPSLSIVFNITLQWIFRNWDGLLTDPFTHQFLTPARFAKYCQAVRRKTSVPLDV